jgi:hypothetical protein
VHRRSLRAFRRFGDASISAEHGAHDALLVPTGIVV